MKTYYSTINGKFADPIEAATYLYNTTQRISKIGYLTNDQTNCVICKFAKRYEMDKYFAEQAIKGLVYGEANKRYSIELCTNFGQYNLLIEKR